MPRDYPCAKLPSEFALTPSPPEPSYSPPLSLDSTNETRIDNQLTSGLNALHTEVPQSSHPWTQECECGGIGIHTHQATMMNGTGNGDTGARRIGRLPNFVQVAKAYVFEQQIQRSLQDTGVSQAREDSIRLAGVQWIDNVRRALKLPVKTFNTAVVYYHKFRLQHSDGEYSFVDAAAAALFTACKIEDTLKKSRDIICAAHNLKVPRQEHLSPDDAVRSYSSTSSPHPISRPFAYQLPVAGLTARCEILKSDLWLYMRQAFEHQSRSIIGLERLMLEASGFDFRNRHPQDLMIKIAKLYNFQRTSPVVRTAYSMSLDLYRTFAPLKQQTAALAFACLELSGRLHDIENSRMWNGDDYGVWKIDRPMVMETMLDLLELYTHHRTSTAVGPDSPVDTFLTVRIPLNVESEEKKIARYTEWVSTDGPGDGSGSQGAASGRRGGGGGVNGNGVAATNGGSHVRSRSSSKNNVSPQDVTVSPSTNASSVSTAPTSVPGGGALRQRMGERGREGTVRFILNPGREREERSIVELFRKD
ncbi:RNA polymerase II C-terminal domain kinase beta subunit [Exophiala xenobiotica]|uniref:RNA polymerase II holoenzyme cyclin-like subunit n=1 Tax=Vermiconidia calcicola TaxID=1690605 RepID=A0AAV9PYS4_9PEZI|nr:RNA polymerase II C-terminal domain kinase beta subunit [Exophiala xenobiotica]KAK5435472.1 RNA polymerase II C-terminal domain kinase beta subunit [Exophiala xenobiotica]KAK5529677.1 RNA polymerase II C-terminal domain kinase beta subunit [Vermiconidia calcicola]KAK5549119.1 RNA polymerase II C-terminal domain kinase beta subunit [Chaetothyriales sp. CCFEE 6169]